MSSVLWRRERRIVPNSLVAAQQSVSHNHKWCQSTPCIEKHFIISIISYIKWSMKERLWGGTIDFEQAEKLLINNSHFSNWCHMNAHYTERFCISNCECGGSEMEERSWETRKCGRFWRCMWKRRHSASNCDCNCTLLVCPRPAMIEHLDRQFVFVLEFKRKCPLISKVPHKFSDFFRPNRC